MSSLVWNMEERPLPEKLLVLAVLWVFLFGCVLGFFFKCISHAGDSF